MNYAEYLKKSNRRNLNLSAVYLTKYNAKKLKGLDLLILIIIQNSFRSRNSIVEGLEGLVHFKTINSTLKRLEDKKFILYGEDDTIILVDENDDRLFHFNFIQFPAHKIEKLYNNEISLNEFKLYLYLVKTKNLQLSQNKLSELTGIQQGHVCRGIKNLHRSGFILTTIELQRSRYSTKYEILG